jgi:hypothetical protein
LKVIDVTDPSRPVPVKRTFPAKIWSFRVSGSFVYAADGWFGLVILDLSTAAPSLRGCSRRWAGLGPVRCGQTALVANQMSGIDVSWPIRTSRSWWATTSPKATPATSPRSAPA